jgi:mono/diheme cytochrome c family protein
MYLHFLRASLACLSFLFFGLGVRAQSSAASPSRIDFSREIRPVLSKNCFPCHGADEGNRKAKLRLDVRELALQPRRKGRAAIVPGKPEQSLVIKMISEERMPPEETGNRLTSAQVETIRRWIQQGAVYSPHWAFVKPQRPAIPEVNRKSWPRNAIDCFILARLEQEGLQTSPEADRFLLLRRASLDLRGLPPSREEIDRFTRDTAPGAYERVVDRFLADPAFGERWARVWLDLARYADSAGYGSDPLRPNLWPYRDWVIAAFNQNLPYDRFTIEQMAGDLLRDPTQQQRVATAFHRNTMTNTEGGTDAEEFRVAAVKDRINTTVQVWMGLTMGCAQCHSHKYDPISQRDYYSFLAIFNETADANRGDEEPTMPVPTPEQEARIRRIEQQMHDLKVRLERPAPATVARLLARPGSLLPAEWLVIYGKMAALERSRPKLVKLPIMQELPAGQQRVSHVLKKGNFLDPADRVEPAVLPAFGRLPAGAAADRLGLARWLMSPDNPLTARVAVNRFWARLFGTGIVETEEDFGTQGELPSHPELLDWLAVHYRDTLKWDTKALLRLMVTSATYRQSSRTTPELESRDPHNRLLARGPRYRLEAETIRDQALALSGLLAREMGGPSVFPAQPDGLWQAAFNGERTWQTSSGTERHRRALYTFWRRTVPYPSLAAFDAPSRELCTIRRVRSNTPVQAFVTLNDPCYVEAAQALARRIVREGGSSPEERVRFALRMCLVRQPTTQEVNRLLTLFEKEREHYHGLPEAAAKLATKPLGPLPPDMKADELAAWTVVANVLLNMDSVLTKG